MSMEGARVAGVPKMASDSRPCFASQHAARSMGMPSGSIPGGGAKGDGGKGGAGGDGWLSHGGGYGGGGAGIVIAMTASAERIPA